MEFLDYIKGNVPNTGEYFFMVNELVRRPIIKDAWKKIYGGLVQVLLRSGQVYWSDVTSFAWYFRETYQKEYGGKWALDVCKEL